MIKLHGQELTREQATALLAIMRKEYEQNEGKEVYFSDYLEQQMNRKYVGYLIQYLEMQLEERGKK